MDTPEKQALIQEAAQKFEQLIRERGKMEEVKLASFRAPYFLPALGVCANISLYNARTYQGLHGDFVVVSTTQIDDPSSVWPALEAKIAALSSLGLAALERPLGESLGLEEITVSEELLRDPIQDAKRALSLEKMQGRFDAVAARFKSDWGLRLPRWTAVLAAFFDSLSRIERDGLDALGRSAGGVLDYFEDKGLDRKVRAGLDPRLEMRFRRDPPELVSFLWGDSDGLHYGLFYDDPAELPGAIAHNYARDSAETWSDPQTTGISLLSARMRERFDDPEQEEPPSLAEWALRAALRWFEAADRAAVDADGIVRYRGVKRESMLGSISAVLPKSAGNPRQSQKLSEARMVEYKRKSSKVLSEWIAEARDELAKGKPAFAYTLGRELHWLDSDAHRAVSAELLIAAYEALGRHALADILRAHVAHRDLPSVGVYER